MKQIATTHLIWMMLSCVMVNASELVYVTNRLYPDVIFVEMDDDYVVPTNSYSIKTYHNGDMVEYQSWRDGIPSLSTVYDPEKLIAITTVRNDSGKILGCYTDSYDRAEYRLRPAGNPSWGPPGSIVKIENKEFEK